MDGLGPKYAQPGRAMSTPISRDVNASLSSFRPGFWIARTWPIHIVISHKPRPGPLTALSISPLSKADSQTRFCLYHILSKAESWTTCKVQTPWSSKLMARPSSVKLIYMKWNIASVIIILTFLSFRSHSCSFLLGDKLWFQSKLTPALTQFSVHQCIGCIDVILCQFKKEKKMKARLKWYIKEKSSSYLHETAFWLPRRDLSYSIQLPHIYQLLVNWRSH